MKIWKIIVVGIVYAIIAQVFHIVEAYATMDFYKDPAYFSVWSKIMMPGEGAPPNEFYYYSIMFSIITGIIFAVVYETIKKGLPGESIRKGFYYGFLVFLISGIPFFLTMYLLINLPTTLLIVWLADSLIIYLIVGAIIAWLNK